MSLLNLCEDLNIRVRCYSPESRNLMKQLGIPSTGGGYAALVGGQTYILYDRSRSPEERRYIIAHELGHIVLGHLTFRLENGTYPANMETEANIFAAVVLANELSSGKGENHDRVQMERRTSAQGHRGKPEPHCVGSLQ